MRFDWDGDEVPAEVRGRQLRRHRAWLDRPHSAAVVLLAQGPPRAWQRSLDAASRGLRDASVREHDAESLLAAAAKSVKRRAAALIDEDAAQAHAAAISVGKDGQAAIATAGSCRVYLVREGAQRRVSAREASRGLVDGFSFPRRVERLRPGDLLVMAPSHVFSVTGMATLLRILEEDRSATASTIVRSILSPCAETGGAAVALRVP